MKRNYIHLSLCLACGALTTAHAGELDLSATVAAEYIDQDYQFENDDDLSGRTIQVVPEIGLTYTSKGVSANILASHIQQEFDNGNTTTTHNFTNISAASSFTLVERLLQLNVQGSQSYNAFNPNNVSRNLFLSPNRDINQVRRFNTSLVSSILTGDYFGGSLSASYSRSETEQDNQTDLDTHATQVNLQLNDGDALSQLNWSLSAVQQRSENFGSGDFTTQYLNFALDFKLIGDWGIALNASHDVNDISSDDEAGRDIRDFTSYGAGINYSPAPGRSLSITFNTIDSDDESQDGDTFVGGNLNWEFSPRTQLNASASKRFFGRTSGANLVYNLKHLRAVASRSETVTSTSRLFSDGVTLTPFVCGAGALSVNDCFLPNTTDYTLAPGEIFINFPQQNFSLIDSVIINKNDSLALFYDKRKTTISLIVSRAQQEYLEQNRILDTDSIALDIGYQAGVFTELSAFYQIQDNEQLLTDTDAVSEGKTTEYGVAVDRDFGQQLTSRLSVERVKKEGEVSGFSNFSSDDYTENRITLSVSYTQ